MSVVCCIGSGLCVELITRTEESFRMCERVILKPQNEVALALFSLLLNNKKYDTKETDVSLHSMT
jgi:hypothetical protein